MRGNQKMCSSGRHRTFGWSHLKKEDAADLTAASLSVVFSSITRISRRNHRLHNHLRMRHRNRLLRHHIRRRVR